MRKKNNNKHNFKWGFFFKKKKQKSKVQFEYEIIFSGLTPTALIVVPKRQFGQGKKIRIYGHSKVKAANPAPVATYFLYLLPGKFQDNYVLLFLTE